MPIKDPDARRAHHREYMRLVWYPRNRARHLATVARSKKRQRARVAALVAELKGQCSRCPEAHPATLEFHHRDASQKLFTIANAVHEGHSVDSVRAEITKCDVLCSNCHRKLHWEERMGAVA